MADTTNAVTAVNGYHAHGYYDSTKPGAERLAEQIGTKFSVRRGGFFDAIR